MGLRYSRVPLFKERNQSYIFGSILTLERLDKITYCSARITTNDPKTAPNRKPISCFSFSSAVFSISIGAIKLVQVLLSPLTKK